MYFLLFQERQVGGSWEFNCQHGPMECIGNLIQVYFKVEVKS